MLKLYHILREGDPFGGSRNGCKALIALEEIGEKYEVVALQRMTECRPADAPYRKINPNGVTPAIDDGGFMLWESSAILQHLARTRPAANLLPTESRALATVQQWLAWEAATLAPSLLALFFAMTRQPEPVAADVEATKAAYVANLKILDDHLRGREYIAGTYSVADIACGALVPISFLLGLDLSGYGNLVQWLRRLRARPAFQRADAVMADMAAGEKVLA
jgi:glutathione S-transferase